MLYPKNKRYHSTYHEPLFFEPSKDVADSRTQTYFHWYKGKKNSADNETTTQDKNFYPSRWPRITNNERNSSHDVFKFGNCPPLHETKDSESNISLSKGCNDEFKSLDSEKYLKQQQKLKKENEMKHINGIKLQREKREKERWNQIINSNKENYKRIEEKRIRTRDNRTRNGYNIINHQYVNDPCGQKLALRDSIDKEKYNFLAMKRYEQFNSYDPVKGIDVVKQLPTLKTWLGKLDSLDTTHDPKQDQAYTVHNENNASSIDPVYRLGMDNQMNTKTQLERLLLSSNKEYQKRKEKVSELQKKK